MKAVVLEKKGGKGLEAVVRTLQQMREIKAGVDEEKKHALAEGVVNEACEARWIRIEKEWQKVVILNLNEATFDEFKEVVENQYIRDKKTFLVRKLKDTQFGLNRGQLKLLRAIWEQARENKPIRIILLKARQFGGSTVVEAVMYLFSREFLGTQYHIISYEKKSSKHLYDMYDLYWNNDPHKRARKYTKEGLEYKECGGSIQLMTGYTKNTGRSFTLHGVHISEIAMWRVPDQSMLAVLQCVPWSPLTIIVLESTADGASGYFYDKWNNPIINGVRDSYVRVFVGWWELEEYSMEFTSRKERSEFESSIRNEEKAMMRDYKLTMEQLKWRRHMIVNNCDGDEEKFRQEYPSNPEEAFLCSGRGVFSGTMLHHIKQRMSEYEKKNKPWTGDILINKTQYGYSNYTGKTIPSAGGYLTVYEKPDPEKCYAIGVDVSQGLEKDIGREKNSDYSSITVLCYGGFNLKPTDLPKKLGMDGEISPVYEVANWYGLCDTDDLAYLVDFLAKKYNMANVGIEGNGYGESTLKWLREALKYPKSRIYKSYDFNAAGRKQGTKLGWYTTQVTRPLLVTDLVAAIREDVLWMVSRAFSDEARTFIRSATGRAEAASGARDDKIFSTGIAVQVINRMEPRRENDTWQASQLEKQINVMQQLSRLKRGQSYNGLNVI